jgi:methionine biosynthesis protein MetW
MDATNLPSTTSKGAVRVDLLLVADMVEAGTRALDVGCGDGSLLEILTRDRNVDGRGIELSQAGVNGCVAKGLSVVQGDADTDLVDYPDDAFDYVILSQTLQATHRPREVLEHMLRIGRRAVVSFPNFGHWRVRSQLMLFGRMPRTASLTYSWYDTPNIHLCTIRDFVQLVDDLGASIDRAVALDRSGAKMRVNAPWWVWNMFGEQAVFLLHRQKGG